MQQIQQCDVNNQAIIANGFRGPLQAVTHLADNALPVRPSQTVTNAITFQSSSVQIQNRSEASLGTQLPDSAGAAVASQADADTSAALPQGASVLLAEQVQLAA